MIKKLTKLTKTLLVAAGLCVGSMSAWADGTLRTLNSQDYESIVATDWTGTVDLGTGDATYGKYAICNPASSANRGSYKAITLDTAWGISNGYTTAAMTTKGYIVEFDLQLSSGNIKNRSQSQFFVMTSSRTETGYNAYSGNDYIFGISQPTRTDDSEIQDGKAIGFDTDWYVNDLTHSSSSSKISLTRNGWYHVKLVVSATSVDYTITDNSTSSIITNGTGAKSVESLPSIWGFWTLAARGYGSTYFDNLKIYNYSDLPTATYSWGQNYVGLVASDVTMSTSDDATFSYGIKNTYVDEMYGVPSADNGESMATDGRIAFEVNSTKPKKWMLRPTSKGNGIYNFTSGAASVHIYTLTKGQLVKVTGSALCNGSGVLTALTDYDDGTTRFYHVNADGVGILSADKNIYIASIQVYNFDNEVIGLLDKSTTWAGWLGSNINLSSGEAKKVTFRNHGTTIDNGYNWQLGIWYDGAFAQNIRSDWYSWGTGVWTNSYTFSKDGGLSFSDDDIWLTFNSDMLDTKVELTLSYTNGYFYVNGTSTKGNDVYYHNFVYGNGTLTEDIRAFLYVDHCWLEVLSYDDVSVSAIPAAPSSVTPSVPVTIGAKDWTTFASPYALDLTNLPDGVKAYYAATDAVETGNNKITLTEKSDEAVAAGTGLMFKGTADTSYNIPVAASGSDISANNLLKGCTTSTTITNATANYANFYVLVNGESAAEFQNLATYVESNDVTIAAGKAYLDATVTGGARSLKIVFGDETTGINTVQSAERSENCYNLAGQRVATPQKGLYIVSGKKVIIK